MTSSERDNATHEEWMPNLLGIGAIVLWSTTIAFSRMVTDALGVVAAIGSMYLGGGALLCVIEIVKSRGIHRFRAISRSYLVVCGSLFVAYTGCLIGAVGLAANGREVVEVGMLNYLWPGLVVVFSVPILRYQARWWLLVPGVLIGFAGIALVLGGQTGVSPKGFARGFCSSPVAYSLGLLAGIMWGLYSNLVRRLGDPKSVSATPLFTLAAGIVFTPLIFFSNKEMACSPKVIAAIAYLAVFTVAMGYVFWEIGMKKGNIVLLGSLSFFTPVLSTVITCVLLKVRFGLDLLAGCVLVTAGAWACKLAVRSREKSD